MSSISYTRYMSFGVASLKQKYTNGELTKIH